MSSTLQTAMDALQAAFAAALPARVVTRNLVDFSQRSAADLTAGVYTLVLGGESGFANYIGREADLGELDLDLVGQLQVGSNTEPHAVEDAEAIMIDEIKAFCRNVPGVVDQALLEAWHSSRQIEHPYGWVVFKLKVRLNVT